MFWLPRSPLCYNELFCLVSRQPFRPMEQHRASSLNARPLSRMRSTSVASSGSMTPVPCGGEPGASPSSDVLLGHIAPGLARINLLISLPRLLDCTVEIVANPE